MPSSMHVKLGEWSLEALSRKERRFWRPAEKEFVTVFVMPDKYFAEPEKWGRYVVLPDGHVLPHGPTDLEYTQASFVARPDRRVAAKVLVHLIGKVVKLISVETDEETGEEKRNEQTAYFFIGRGTLATIPMDGRLYLGVNDIVFPDNEGYFQVTFGLH